MRSRNPSDYNPPNFGVPLSPPMSSQLMDTAQNATAFILPLCLGLLVSFTTIISLPIGLASVISVILATYIKKSNDKARELRKKEKIEAKAVSVTPPKIEMKSNETTRETRTTPAVVTPTSKTTETTPNITTTAPPQITIQGDRLSLFLDFFSHRIETKEQTNGFKMPAAPVRKVVVKPIVPSFNVTIPSETEVSSDDHQRYDCIKDSLHL